MSTLPETPEPQTPLPAGRRRPLEALAAALRKAIGRLAGNRLGAMLLAGAGLLMVGTVATVSVVIATRKPAEKLVTLNEALAALDGGEYAEARRLAEKLQTQGTLTTAEWGGPVFILGVVADHEARNAWDKDKPDHYLVAARYLEEARNRGFPRTREAEGLYLLGKCLSLGGQYSAARGALEAALKINPARKSELHRLLGKSYLEDAKPDLARAMKENAIFLADPKLTPVARGEGLLERAQILFRLNRTGECLAILDKIPAAANIRGPATVLRGQILYQQAHALAGKTGATAQERAQARRQYELAVETFRLAQGRDTVSNQATRQAMYLIGVCLLETGDQPAALGQFARTAKLFNDTAEGLAAGFQEAELLRQLKRDAEALAAYRRVLGAISDPSRFHNPWISLDQLRLRILAAYRAYIGKQKLEMALQLSRQFYPLLPQTQALELTAEVHTRWGQTLSEQAEQAAPGRADWLRHLGRAQERLAGGVYWRLARLEVADRQYPDRLWHSASAYLAGQDYRNAVRVLQEYLKNEARQRHPQALLAMGEAMLAMNQMDQALAAFQACVSDHPRDAAAYRARLLASRAWAEKGDFAKAEALLQENLSGEHLTPDSKEWRDSLFALGELLHSQGRDAEAIRRLEEFVERYADLPQSLVARGLIADACRRNAQTLLGELSKEVLSGNRATRLARVNQLFTKALCEYRRIEDALGHRDDNDLTPLEKAMLRNSQFAIGEICFDMQEYEAAARAYASAANRFAERPETLEAYVRLADAYRHLGRLAQARSTLEQAKVVLKQMKPDVRFDETTNYDRKQWGDRLAWLSSL